MKLIIQIPCYNEAETLPIAINALPEQVAGFDCVEYLIIDDGCTDDTVAVARQLGVQHIVRLPKNLGLARGFMAGLEYALQQGADVIVNTDADNQYNADDIPALTQPILDGSAQIVIGERPIATTRHFSPLKKSLQHLGSWVVRVASHSSVPDAPSGFRAFSREAAMQLNVFSNYTYTLETIIQAGRKNMAVTSVPVGTNPDLRPSRLFKSIPAYIRRSIATILRIFVVYKPFRVFMLLGLGIFGLGFLLGLRFVYFYFSGDGDGHIQSLILTGILLAIGFQTMLVAFLADLMAVNRSLLEELQYRDRRRTYRQSEDGSKPLEK